MFFSALFLIETKRKIDYDKECKTEVDKKLITGSYAGTDTENMLQRGVSHV